MALKIIHIDEDAFSEIFGESVYPKQIIDSIIEDGKIPEKFWYWSQRSASLWKDLSSETGGGAHTLIDATKELIKQKSGDIVREIFKNEKWKVASDMSYIDLGAGDSEKEIEIIGALERQLSSNPMYYDPIKKRKLIRTLHVIPIDISLVLITDARKPVKRSKIRIRYMPVLGYFEKIKEYIKRVPALHGMREDTLTQNPKLISFLGNTIGNIDNCEELLEEINSLMTPNGFILMDFDPAEIYYRGRNEKKDAGNLMWLEGEYGLDTKKQEIRNKTLKFVAEPLLHLVGEEYCNIENSIKIDSEIQKIELGSEMIETKRVVLTYEYKKEDRENNVISKLIEMYEMEHQHSEDAIETFRNREKIELAWSTKYPKKEFLAYLHSIFEEVENFEGEKGHVLCLMKKRVNKPPLDSIKDTPGSADSSPRPAEIASSSMGVGKKS